MIDADDPDEAHTDETLSDPLTDDGRYRLLIDAVTDYAIYMLDPSGIVSSWNPGAERFKGYRAAEIIGQHFSRFYTPVEREAGLPARSLQAAEREGRCEIEGWRVRKDGSEFWAHVVIDPIRDPSGKLIGFAKITRDLTERKAAEETLRRSEQQFRLLVQGVTDYAIYMLDPNGLVSNWNYGAERIKGYLSTEIIGRHFSTFYTEEDRTNGEPERALTIAASEGRYEREGWRVRKDGTRFLANVVIDAIYSDSRELLGFAKITRDITESRAAQAALDKARETLIQSQKVEAIGQLTGGIAHDFNNLLMAVLGSLELVRKRLPDDQRILALIDNAIKGAQRGAALTQRMLAFARRQELKLERVDVPGLVRGMTELLQRSLGPSVLIETRFPLSLQSVMADANQLEMALLNLVVNARDAMPDGGLITISAKEHLVISDAGHLAPGEYVCLCVTDAGEGMDESTLARAMEPFFTTKGIGKGTGLGLPMVHGLAQQSGGHFELKSKKGAGTTAELWLPVASADPAKMPTETPQAMATRTRPLSILAVDDDSLVLMNTVAMLEELGHKVFEAGSGKEALNILHRENIDMLITDQAMPHMTGAELAEAVAEKWPNIPIIIATGYAELPDGGSFALVKLSKPFGSDDLEQAVAEAAHRQRPPAQILRFPFR
jgi:PAS domain S-box-containing protein